MDEPRPLRGAGPRHRPDRVRIDREGPRRVILGLVHAGEGRTVDERIEAQVADERLQPVPLGEVQRPARQRHQVEGRPGHLVRPAHGVTELAVGADEQHARAHED